jgi:predicted site-specific integrase-resolvase
MDTLTIKDQKYFSIKAAVEKYQVSRKTIHQWIKEGKMEKKKIGSASFVRMK